LAEFQCRDFEAEKVGRGEFFMAYFWPWVGYSGWPWGLSGNFVEVFLIGMCLHSAKLVGDAEGPLLVRQKRLDAHFSFLGR